jgi:hypothetical protein
MVEQTEVVARCLRPGWGSGAQLAALPGAGSNRYRFDAADLPLASPASSASLSCVLLPVTGCRVKGAVTYSKQTIGVPLTRQWNRPLIGAGYAMGRAHWVLTPQHGARTFAL